MSPKTRRREEADRVLLTEGPKPIDELMLLMLPWIGAGEAARKGQYLRAENRKRLGVKSPRKSESDPDIYDLGRRRLTRQTVWSAVKRGAWIRDGDMVRHRDWIPPTTDAEPCSPEGTLEGE